MQGWWPSAFHPQPLPIPVSLSTPILVSKDGKSFFFFKAYQTDLDSTLTHIFRTLSRFSTKRLKLTILNLFLYGQDFLSAHAHAQCSSSCKISKQNHLYTKKNISTQRCPQPTLSSLSHPLLERFIYTLNLYFCSFLSFS